MSKRKKTILCLTAIIVLMCTSISFGSRMSILEVKRSVSELDGISSRRERIYTDRDTGVEYIVLTGNAGSIAITPRFNADGTLKVSNTK